MDPIVIVKEWGMKFMSMVDVDVEEGISIEDEIKMTWMSSFSDHFVPSCLFPSFSLPPSQFFIALYRFNEFSRRQATRSASVRSFRVSSGL